MRLSLAASVFCPVLVEVQFILFREAVYYSFLSGYVVNVATGPVKFSVFDSPTWGRGLGAGQFGVLSDVILFESLRFSRQYASIWHMRSRKMYERIRITKVPKAAVRIKYRASWSRLLTSGKWCGDVTTDETMSSLATSDGTTSSSAFNSCRQDGDFVGGV